MKVVKSMVLAASLFSVLSPSQALAAKEVAGVQFEDRVVVGGQNLLLNGAGLRMKMIIKVYAVALYLAGRETSASAVLTQPGPKSVRIVMLRDVSAADLSDALVKGMVKNLTPSEMLALQPRLEELQATLRTAGEAHKGDAVQLDYVPGQGTRITQAGRLLGRDIPGEDFYQGLLKIWLGERPSDGDLKTDLLGVARR